MVRVADCHAGVLGSNPGGPRYFPLGITSVFVFRIRPCGTIFSSVDSLACRLKRIKAPDKRE